MKNLIALVCMTGYLKETKKSNNQFLKPSSKIKILLTPYNLVVSFLLTAGHDTAGYRINVMLQLDEGKKMIFFELLEQIFKSFCWWWFLITYQCSFF